MNRIGGSVIQKNECVCLFYLVAENHYFIVYHVGGHLRYTCRWIAPTTLRTSILRDGKEVVASDTNSTLVEFRPVNESIHGSIITCLRVRTDGSKWYSNNTIVVTGKLVNGL